MTRIGFETREFKSDTDKAVALFRGPLGGAQRSGCARWL